MNASPGGGFLPDTPIWHPPISVPWIVSLLVLIGAANVEVLPPQLLHVLTHPVGFFVVLLIALGAYDVGFPPAAFAILFLLLMVWSTHQRRKSEGFTGASGTVDWVTNNKRWFVEAVLKEKPLGVQDKNVSTYPVQGDNSLPSS